MGFDTVGIGRSEKGGEALFWQPVDPTPEDRRGILITLLCGWACEPRPLPDFPPDADSALADEREMHEITTALKMTEAEWHAVCRDTWELTTTDEFIERFRTLAAFAEPQPYIGPKTLLKAERLAIRQRLERKQREANDSSWQYEGTGYIAFFAPSFGC